VNPMPDKLHQALAVLAAHGADFITLARLGGLDPSRHFRGADLRNVDFGEDNLADTDFTGADFRGANLERVRGLNISNLVGVKSDARTRWPVSLRNSVRAASFDRTDERNTLMHLLRDGHNVELNASRRGGKTWLLRHLADDLRSENWKVLFLDAEGWVSTLELVRALQVKIADLEHSEAAEPRLAELQDVFRSVDSSEPNQAAHVDDKWAPRVDKALYELERKFDLVAFIIDEFDLFVQRLARNKSAESTTAQFDIEVFFLEFQQLRTSHPRIRWVLSASHDLKTIFPRFNLRKNLNDIHSLSINPLDSISARNFLFYLSSIGEVPRPFVFDDGAFELLVEELGPATPHHLKLIAHAIIPTGPETVGGWHTATKQDVAIALEAILNSDLFWHFRSIDDQIRSTFDFRRAEIIRRIVGLCAEQRDGATLELLRRDVQLRKHGELLSLSLQWLIEAGLLSESRSREASRYFLTSELLRRYWLRNEDTMGAADHVSNDEQRL